MSDLASKRVLLIPTGTPGVRLYRFERASRLLPNIVTYNPDYKEGWENRFMEWISENGLEWDVVWTGDYSNPMGGFLSMFKEHGAEIICNVDDWFEMVPNSNVAHKFWAGERREAYRYLIEISSRVLASTPPLVEKHGGTLTPNFVDPDEWKSPARKTKKDGECVILCPSGVGRAGDYLMVEDALQRALRIDGVKVVFMGWFPEWALNYPAGKVVWVRWVPTESYQKTVCHIAPDIIISPMEHNIFTNAKSNLKFLESGAVGACFVGERWGEYERTVEDGVTGVLASGIEEWGDALCELALDAGKRRQIARAGQDEVLANWTWETMGPMWKEAIYGTGISGRDHCCLDRGTAAGGHVRQSEEVCGSCPECRESA